jgi:hypothetical protein
VKRLFIVLVVILCGISLIGCNNKDDNEENNNSQEVTLDAETEKYIKECFWNYRKEKFPGNLSTIDDITIKHYYGDFDGIKIAVILGDGVKTICVVGPPYYYCLVENKFFMIKYLPEIISVYYENNYYTLIDACMEGLITEEILDQLDCYYQEDK